MNANNKLKNTLKNVTSKLLIKLSIIGWHVVIGGTR